jgi:hypothetical protein
MSNRGAGEQLGIVKARIPAPMDRRPTERDGAVELPVPVVRDTGGRARHHDLTNTVTAGHWGPGRFAAALPEAIADGHSDQAGRSDGELADQSATTSHPQGR